MRIFLFSALIALSFYATAQNVAVEKKPIYQADPTIFYDNGVYYLYGTNDLNSNRGFVVYSSDDQMKSWTNKGTVLSKADAYGDKGFWAPQVWKQEGKFYMAYTANENIAIAEGDSPLGPFKQKEKHALPADQLQIDPFIFMDDDGKKYFYHVRLNEGNRIWVAEMNADLSDIKAGTAKECITAEKGTWEHVADNNGWTVTEGPTVIKRAGKYYMFYSANDFRDKGYAVGYAVSDHPLGPWKRYAGNPIIHQSITGHPGSGHGDVFKGEGAKLYYVFHTHNSESKVGPRKTAIIELKEKSKKGLVTFEADKKSFKFLE